MPSREAPWIGYGKDAWPPPPFTPNGAAAGGGLNTGGHKATRVATP